MLGLDSNFFVINEPPGKYRGIRSIDINGWQVQLITRITYAYQLKKFDNSSIYHRIRNKRIIGVSWSSPSNCRSVGRVIDQHAYDRFGPCD